MAKKLNQTTGLSNGMAAHPDHLITSTVSIGSLFFSAYLLRWAIAGLLNGRIRYRLKEHNRFKHPVYFWFAVIWGLGAGIVFLLGGLLVFYMGTWGTRYSL